MILWRKSSFSPMSRPRIWTTSNGIQCMCWGKEAGRCLCVWVPGFDVQKPHTVNHAESFWGQQATCWYPDRCRQGALGLKAERQSICEAFKPKSKCATAWVWNSGAKIPSHPVLSRGRGRTLSRGEQILILPSSLLNVWEDSRKVSKPLCS